MSAAGEGASSASPDAGRTAVILDLDGTLLALPVDIEPARARIAALFAARGFVAPFRPLLARIDEAATAVVRDPGDRAALIAAARAILDDAELAAAPAARALPGAAELLATLAARGVPVGIWTDNGRACVVPAMRAAGLEAGAAAAAERLCSRDDAPAAKPDPRGLAALAATLLGRAPGPLDRVFVLGDSDRDLAAAHAFAASAGGAAVIGLRALGGAGVAAAELFGYLDAAALIDHGGTAVAVAAQIARIVALPAATLTVRTDLGGNVDEIAVITTALAERLPPALRQLTIVRRGQWDIDAGEQDDILLEAGPDGETLTLEVAVAAPPRAITALLSPLLARHGGITALELHCWARDRVEIDDVLAIVAAAPRPALRSLVVRFADNSGRDWLRFLSARRLAEVLVAAPGLVKLSLTMAELWLDRLAHATLAELELHQLYMTPLGPYDLNGVGRPARAAGLAFLRDAELPALGRLAIDFQYDWYVPWHDDDVAALAAATLPSLRHLELRWAMPAIGNALCRALPTASYASQLEVLDLTGTVLDADGVRALLAARDRFPRLTTLVAPLCDAASRDEEIALAGALAAAYPWVDPP